MVHPEMDTQLLTGALCSPVLCPPLHVSLRAGGDALRLPQLSPKTTSERKVVGEWRVLYLCLHCSP